MKPYLIVLIVIAAVMVVAAVLLYALWRRLPSRVAGKMRGGGIFGGEQQLKLPKDYEKYLSAVTRVKDLAFPSQHPDARYDVYFPKGIAGRLPVILWVHGGGFVDGTKDGTETLMTILASYGYFVLSMDYAIAPETKYPAAVVQVSEMARHLMNSVARDYPAADTQRIFLGGDSAGGQMAGQFAAIETNAAFRAEMGFIKQLPEGAVKGLILISAPNRIGTMLPPVNFKLKLVQQIFNRGYFGFAHRARKRGLMQTDLCAHVTPDFPPAYLTDGNRISFEAQNRALGCALKGKGVEVRELYFDKERWGDVNHEYVFEMDEEKTPLALEGIKSFLQDHRGQP